jgi:hypothetical protein
MCEDQTPLRNNAQDDPITLRDGENDWGLRKLQRSVKKVSDVRRMICSAGAFIGIVHCV